MQQEKIVLPKFTVPGQTNWVKWALVGVGGLVVLSAVLFGVALATRTPAPEAVAAPAKPVDVPLAPSATPRPVKQPGAALGRPCTSSSPGSSPLSAGDWNLFQPLRLSFAWKRRKVKMTEIC